MGGGRGGVNCVTSVPSPLKRIPSFSSSRLIDIMINITISAHHAHLNISINAELKLFPSLITVVPHFSYICMT